MYIIINLIVHKNGYIHFIIWLSHSLKNGDSFENGLVFSKNIAFLG